MDEICKMYRKQALLGFAVYTAVAFATMWLVEKYPLGAWRIPVALTPIVPALFIACSIVHMFSSGDELQIRIHFESLAFAFVATALLTLTCGFLQGLAGVSIANWAWVWPLMGTLFIIGKPIAKRKYR
jgi:O-antigen/teichoic acid export membrane protein